MHVNVVLNLLSDFYLFSYGKILWWYCSSWMLCIVSWRSWISSIMQTWNPLVQRQIPTPEFQSPFLSCWTLIAFFLFYLVFFSYLKAIWNYLLIPLPSFLLRYLLAQTGGFQFCANWEGQVCICILHLLGIIANHKANLLAVQPWILWFLVLEMTQVERFKEKCIVCITASILGPCL